MNSHRRNEVYIKYLKDHPECLNDEPPHASSKAFWQKMMEEERCTGGEMARSVAQARHRWEKYHIEKAEMLGFKISIQQLHVDKNWLFGIKHQPSKKMN